MGEEPRRWDPVYLSHVRKWVATHPDHGPLGILCQSAGSAQRLADAMNKAGTEGEGGPDKATT